MSIETLKNALPDYARDLKLNLDSLSKDIALADHVRAGTFIACAMACNEPTTMKAIYAEFASQLNAEQQTAAKAASALMGMNNIYYRFVHLASNEEYGKMPAKLRMNFIANPGVPKTEFELWSLAVSAINGCGMCIDSHERILRQHDVTAEQVQAAARIAATVHAVARVIAAEAALAGSDAATLAA